MNHSPRHRKQSRRFLPHQLLVRLSAIFAVFGLALGGSLAVAPAASASDVTVVNAKVVSTPDNTVENAAWARDTFTRVTTLTQTGEDTYDVRIDDGGTFVTADGVKGSVRGFVEYTIHGTLDQNAVADLRGDTYDYSSFVTKNQVAAANDPGLPTTSKWALQYFESDAHATGISDWDYVYSGPGGSYSENGGDGTAGVDFTFSTPVKANGN